MDILSRKKRRNFGALLCFVLLLSAIECSYAQNVGINTLNPQMTLDVMQKQDIATTRAEGVLPPTFTGNELKEMDSLYLEEHEGTIVYVTEPATPPFSRKSINLSTPGYYYYDGNIWHNVTGERANINFYGVRFVIVPPWGPRITPNRIYNTPNNPGSVPVWVLVSAQGSEAVIAGESSYTPPMMTLVYEYQNEPFNLDNISVQALEYNTVGRLNVTANNRVNVNLTLAISIAEITEVEGKTRLTIRLARTDSYATWNQQTSIYVMIISRDREASAT